MITGNGLSLPCQLLHSSYYSNIGLGEASSTQQASDECIKVLTELLSIMFYCMFILVIGHAF